MGVSVGRGSLSREIPRTVTSGWDAYPTGMHSYVACIFRLGARSWRRRLRSMLNSACSSMGCSSGMVPPTHLSDKIFTTQTVSLFYSQTKTFKTKSIIWTLPPNEIIFSQWKRRVFVQTRESCQPAILGLNF